MKWNFCPTCGIEFRPEWQHCPQCGAVIGTIQAQIHVPSVWDRKTSTIQVPYTTIISPTVTGGPYTFTYGGRICQGEFPSDAQFIPTLTRSYQPRYGSSQHSTPPTGGSGVGHTASK